MDQRVTRAQLAQQFREWAAKQSQKMAMKKAGGTDRGETA